MNELFFELIRLSIGTNNYLSQQPSAEEWGELYRMAVKQSFGRCLFCRCEEVYGTLRAK